MDIRKFFGSQSSSQEEPKKKKVEHKSVLSEVKEKANAGPSKKPSSSPSPSKKRSDKVGPPVLDLANEDSDESPLPASLRMDKKKKRQRVILSSDSEDQFPAVKTKGKASKEPSSSPVKKREPEQVKKKSRVIRDPSSSPEKPKSPPKKKQSGKKGKKPLIPLSSDDEDEEIISASDSEDEFSEKKAKKKESSSSKKPKSPPKKKPSVKKGKQPLILPSDEDEEMISATDSEDEFAEKKVKKKDAIPKGQKTLTFKAATTAAPAKEKSVPKRAETAIDPSTFFGGPSAPVHKKVEETKKKKAEEEEKEVREKIDRDTETETQSGVLMDRSNDTRRVSPRKQKSVEKEKEEEKHKEKEMKRTRRESENEEKGPSPKKQRSDTREKKQEEDKKTEPSPKKQRSDPAVHEKKQEKKEVSKQTSQSQPTVKERKAESATTTTDKAKEAFFPWVDKYKPKSLQQLVGQGGDKAPMKKLMNWLNGWKTWHLGEGAKIKRPKPPPFVETDGSPFKAVLLSGPPGIGKTTCSHMACDLLGFKCVEMNASDVRNKKHLEAQVAQLTGCHQMEEYFGMAKQASHDDHVVHHVLIMDEVDGMSGNEDRAGLSELIAIIKDTKIPIICICNDRGHAKMRTLVNYAFDVRFPRPRAEMLIARVMTIASQEKVKLNKEEAMQIIEQSGHDVRQTIYNLQMMAIGGKKGQIEQKDCAVNTFEAARKLLSQSSTLAERQEMFFVDYGIMSLFVQENYASMRGNSSSSSSRNELQCLRRASDLLSLGDTVEKAIRSGGSWKLLNEQSMLSAALPAIAMDGQMKGMIQFPSWLGKNSTAGKRQRLMRQVQHHAHLKMSSASPHALVMDYVPVLRNRLTIPLVEREGDGVSEVVATMVEYDLLKEDAEAIAELAVWPGVKDPGDRIAPKVKAALTRALNKTSRKLPYELDDVTKGKKKAAGGAGMEDEVEVDEFGCIIDKKNEDEALEEDEEEDEKKPEPGKKTATGGGRGGGAGSRGGRGGGRGRGRGK